MYIVVDKYVSFGFVPCLPLEKSLIYVSEEFLYGWFCRLNVDWKFRFWVCQGQISLWPGLEVPIYFIAYVLEQFCLSSCICSFICCFNELPSHFKRNRKGRNIPFHNEKKPLWKKARCSNLHSMKLQYLCVWVKVVIYVPGIFGFRWSFITTFETKFSSSKFFLC